METNIRYLQRFLLAAFVLVGLGLGYWQILRAESLLARTDNPRRVIAEQRIRRGPITTSHGDALALTRINATGLAQRWYPAPAAAPAVGYYSLRYGRGGLEAAFDPLLRGLTPPSRLDTLLHRPPVGEILTVTLNLDWQTAAMDALQTQQVDGAVIVMHSETGAVRVLASHPSFDPNTLNETWPVLIEDPGSPLLNRATQGLFALGSLADLLRIIQRSAGHPDLRTTTRQLEFERPVDFILPVVAGQVPDDLPDKAKELTVTPLHIARLAAALHRNGHSPTPHLSTNPIERRAPPQQLLQSQIAAALTPTHYEAEAGPDITGNRHLSWYIGLGAPTDAYVTVIVATRDDPVPHLARQIYTQLEAANMPPIE